MLTSPYQQTSNQPISVYGQPLGMPEFDGEDYDKKQKRAYTAFLRSRPANYLPTLEAPTPPKDGSSPDCSRPTASSSPSLGTHPSPTLQPP